jgi:hypothetical protein
MKHKGRVAIVLAFLLYCTNSLSIGAECRCNEQPGEFSVSAYYVHWLSLTPRALGVKDVIAQAKRNCGVLHFKLSEVYGVGPRLDSTILALQRHSRTRCEEGSFDCRTVYIVRRKRQRDTLAFSRSSSCMLVNNMRVPLDIALMRQLAEYLPLWQASFIIGDTLSRRD